MRCDWRVVIKYKKQIYGKNTGFNSVNIIMNNDSMQSSNLFKPSKSVIGNNQINNKFNMNKSEGPKDNMQKKYN